MTSFASLGLRPRTLSALEHQNIDQPLPVQTAALPALLQHRDAVIQAPTGSGKTLAYLLPLIESLADHRRGGARGLVVAPTRELATQIAGVLQGVEPELRVALLYGGIGYGSQLAALRRDPDVVIGCPGRMLDLADRGELRLGAVHVLVLDEADEMLDQGFARDVERIIGMTAQPARGQARQTILASATMPDWVKRMIDRHLTDPEWVHVQAEQEPDLEHGLVHVDREQRFELLHSLLDQQHDGSTIVFHRTKHGAKKLARDLTRRGHHCSELQGNMSQNARDRAIDDFRHRRTDVLVATNVAARGLDVEHVNLVVNYELPENAQWLTHRVGRTARNGAAGRALTFLGDEDAEQWGKLRRGGAPELRWIDPQRLLETGQLVALDRPAPGTRTAARRPAPGTAPAMVARAERARQPRQAAAASPAGRAVGRSQVSARHLEHRPQAAAHSAEHRPLTAHLALEHRSQAAPRHPEYRQYPGEQIANSSRGGVLAMPRLATLSSGATLAPTDVSRVRLDGLRGSPFDSRDEGDLHVQNGTIKKIVSDRGFGFITGDDGKEYFFHRSSTESDFDSLRGGETVTFTVETSAKGPRAASVRVA